MTIKMIPRRLSIPIFQIDVNLINARQKLPAVNQFEKWYKNEVIIINISGTARQESMVGSNATRARKANQQIYTTSPARELSDPQYAKIERTLFPGGPRDDNQQNDVKIVFEAVKYNAILVTSDGASKRQPGGILGSRHKLRCIVQIMNPEESVAYVKSEIRK